MYIPASFDETRVEVMHQLIADHPLGTLITVGQMDWLPTTSHSSWIPGQVRTAR